MANANIESKIRVKCPDGVELLLTDPVDVMSLAQPTWAKMGMLQETDDLLKAHGVPPERRTMLRIKLTQVMSYLRPALQAELVEQVRRVTGKPDPLWDHDVVLCLTMQCGLSYTEAIALPMEERVRLLLALPDCQGKTAPKNVADISTDYQIDRSRVTRYCKANEGQPGIDKVGREWRMNQAAIERAGWKRRSTNTASKGSKVDWWCAKCNKKVRRESHPAHCDCGGLFGRISQANTATRT